MPAYAAAIRSWGFQPDDVASTPQGFAARLSEEVTLIIKSRAVWESVMDAVYWYATAPSGTTERSLAIASGKVGRSRQPPFQCARRRPGAFAP